VRLLHSARVRSTVSRRALEKETLFEPEIVDLSSERSVGRFERLRSGGVPQVVAGETCLCRRLADVVPLVQPSAIE